MGAKHSKPRIKRERRFSSMRKREAPEGSNDPSPPPKELYNCESPKAVHGIEDSCRFCGLHSDPPRVQRQSEMCRNYAKDPDVHCEKSELHNNANCCSPVGLKVNLPQTDGKECCKRWDSREGSKILPVESTLSSTNKALTNENEKEWTITLYEIDKTPDKLPREDMTALMTSIYEAVNEKVCESPQSRQTVRVRLSVTPERTLHTRLQGVTSPVHKDQTECRCAECPKTEPSSRKSIHDLKSKLRRSDTSSPVRGSNSLSITAKQHSQQISRDYSSENHAKRKQANARSLDTDPQCRNKNVTPSDSRYVFERTKSLPHSRHRPKLEGQRQSHAKTSARHRRHFHESRNVSNNTRKRDPKFASPYDQHFQEAMYLRLRELQRQGAFERRRAIGANDSDGADDDSDCDIKTEEAASSSNPNAETRTQNTKQSNSEHILPVSVGTVHHHHFIYRDGDRDTAEFTEQFAKDCVKKAARSIGTEADGHDKTQEQQNQIHYHHYHLTQAN